MTTPTVSTKNASLHTAKRIATGLLVFCMIALIGCGGTKVYNADKTVVYRGETYNMSSVKEISGRQEATLSDGSVINVRNKDKKDIEALFKENGETLITMTVDLDEQELVYLQMHVDKYSEYSKLNKRFNKALSDITFFMGETANTRLQLK